MNSIYDGLKKCCFTGYRPSKMPFNLFDGNGEYKEFENALTEELLRLIANGCRIFYSGMAMGFDIIAAETVLILKSAYGYQDIKLCCVLPFENQVESFSGIWQKRYYSILKKCDSKLTLSEEYFSGCYQKRNIYMVDNSDCVLTWFDGKSGGTRNTIEYAVSRKKYVINLFKKESENLALQTFLDFD